MKESGKISAFMNGAGFYIVLLLAIAAIGASGYFIYDAIRIAHQPDAIQAQEELSPAPEHTTNPISETQNSATQEPTTRQTIAVSGTTQVAEDAPTAAGNTPSGEDANIVSPLKGKTSVPFSMEQLIYNATLDDWRTHDGIDIAAENGTTVVSAAAGTVTAVVDDYWMGTTITVAGNDGYELVYACLQNTPSVTVGDQLKAGDPIGQAGQTALLEEDQSAHLHFSVWKDGTAIDPSDYLRQTA